MGGIYSIKSYIGRGDTELESVQDFVNKVGKGVRIEMNSSTLYYKGKKYFLYSTRKKDGWISIVF